MSCAIEPSVIINHVRPAKLFEPDEVATVIDVFAPVPEAEPARERQGFDWARVTALMAMVAAVGALGLGLQARFSAPVQPAVTPVARPAPRPRPPQRSYDLQGPPAPAPAAVVTVARPPRFDVAVTLTALNREAQTALARREPARAMTALSRAAVLCRRPALVWHRLCALTHLNTGVVLASGFGQSGLATKHFRIARAIRPELTLPRGLSRRELVGFAWEQARVR